MIINIKRNFFTEKEFLLLDNGIMKATAFKYSTGVEALKIENDKGYFIILPFQGQQIWRLNFSGKELNMQTSFKEPVPTKEYLETYGGFLLHCGINAFGSPQADDNHPQHGELPNADYDSAYIEILEDSIAVGGSFTFNKSFVKSYTFSPKVILKKGESVLKIDVTLKNNRHTPMEYMYLCHINFLPFEGAKLIYTADYNSGVKVYKSPDASAELAEYIDRLEKNPSIHNIVDGKTQVYDPELCLGIEYIGDENNRAYTLQCTDDGACFVSHPVDVLPKAIRWISRSADEQSMGMVLPATAEHLGYNHAKRNGQIKELPPYGELNFYIEAGFIEYSDAKCVIAKIDDINRQ